MNKIISGIAKMIIIRRDIARDGIKYTQSDYLRGRADEADYILDTLKVFYPDEVKAAIEAQQKTKTTTEV